MSTSLLPRTSLRVCTATPIRTTQLSSIRPRFFSVTPPRPASTPSISNTATTSSTISTPTSTPLDWNDFLRLRRSKRRYNLISSIFCATVGVTVGLTYLGEQEIDPSQLIWGIDPMMVLGLGLVGSGAAGWLIGPVAGGGVFRVVNKKLLGDIAQKETIFFHHIKRNRVDPSFQSFSNPVPDYYGEKIGSLHQYRQWLKDQRAYNRKREKFL